MAEAATLWRRFADEDREYLAAKYEAYRGLLIAESRTKELAVLESAWKRSYGQAGMMASVINDLQEQQ